MNTPRHFPGGINEAQEKSNQELSVVSRTTQQKSSSQFPWLIIGLLAHHQILYWALRMVFEPNTNAWASEGSSAYIIGLRYIHVYGLHQQI